MKRVAVRYQGDGEFVALNHKIADRDFVVDELYWLEEMDQRSMVSHAHEFAWLKEAWLQLPEDLQLEIPSPEHLRKRALILTGWYDEKLLDCGTKAAALRVAVYCRSAEPFALVSFRNQIVIIRTAKSQSRRAMKKDEFQDSKTAILDYVSNLIGVKPDVLINNAGRQA